MVNIISWNVNGLKAIFRKDAFEPLLNLNPHIICLQETKLSEKQDFSESIDKDFPNVFFNNSIKKGFSGTSVMSKIYSYNTNYLRDIDKELDGRIIEQDFDKFILINVYFPNGKLNKDRLDVKLRFYRDLFNYCMELKNKKKSIVICGDFNTAHQDIDLKKSKIYNKSGFSQAERDCIDLFLDNGFIDTYRFLYEEDEEAYTWWSYRSKAREINEGWRIDYIFISDDLKDNLIDAYIYDNIQGSDHCPIGITLDIK